MSWENEKTPEDVGKERRGNEITTQLFSFQLVNGFRTGNPPVDIEKLRREGREDSCGR